MPPKSTNTRGRPAAFSRRTAGPTDSSSATSTSGPSNTTTNPNNAPIGSNLSEPRSRNAPSASATPTTRGSVQRLQSLKKRAPTGSLVPLNPDGTVPKPTLRYQPRAVARKGKAEREALERREAERMQEKVREVAAMRSAEARARGVDRDRGRGRGRGRGGVISGGDGSGLLGSGISMRGRGGGGFGGGRLKFGNGGRSGAERVHGLVTAKSEEGGKGESRDVSSDEESDGGPRFSIEQINIISDEEEEAGWGDNVELEEGKRKMPAKGSVSGGSGRGLRPIRVERQEHQERSVGVNTDASSHKSAELRRQAKAKAKEKHGGDESLFVQESEDEDADSVIESEEEVEITSEKALGRAAQREVRIKQEPTEDGDVLMVDTIPQATDDSALTSAPPKPKTKKKRVAIQDPRSKLQTEEERQEWDLHAQDIEHIRQALGTITTHDKPAEGEEAAGREDEAKALEAPKDERSGRLFLIQFPPMTPNLIAQTRAVDATDQDVVETGAQTTTQNPAIPSIKRENTDSLAILKPTSVINNNTNGVSQFITAVNSSLPPGRVGKLNIHQSGRATIDWGGISFDLTKGSDVDFLQDAIVASEGNPKVSGEDGGTLEEPGETLVWAMSQVTGKFVVTPDWEVLLGL
ncbi:hypothetical protein PAAG_06647 [Paracoccidioides lutzii Pb01]|uniref:DNA-directed RNA polymerase III RPC4 n=1 Tax=Paracoccidioides lutzii (strain ATCC MYA-826 / Pb01) TaxID=502779 RepID=C1H7A6_PARBA|nr:hypothetical protein PAAG_06647 [Paracoccidioides lutzii Pb01]EEH35600.1 hypothetical protein PAAG_06647 [Paracoccidioides lutzii Pb01]